MMKSAEKGVEADVVVGRLADRRREHHRLSRPLRRVLRSRRSVVESAAAQLAACRRQAAGVRYDPELAQILARSESIYRQAVAHYNDTLCKPWCRLPGHLLGFDRDTGEDDL